MQRFQRRALPAPAVPAPCREWSPLLPLLLTLRGRTVGLQVGASLFTGRLTALDPVTLVGSGGEVTVLTLSAIDAVQF